MICPRCDGEGEITFNPAWPDPQGEDFYSCPDCRGSGLVARRQAGEGGDEAGPVPGSPTPSPYTTREDYLR